jgi:DnaK suppressor protein
MSAKKAPAKKPAAKPAAAKRAPAKAPAAKPVATKPAAVKPAVKSVAKPAVKSPAKPALKSVPKPAVKIAAKPALKSVPKPAVAPVQPTAKKSAVDLVTFHDFKPYKLQKGEEYMNDAQVAHFRQILMAWKKQLMEEVDRTVHHMQDEAANFPDPNDRATQESEFSMELRTRDRERKLIKKIDEALSNLDTREYGFCDSCGIEIGIRRLEARPTASQCIDCKTLDEIREKQMGT